MGSMIPMSTIPKTNPQITPRKILDIAFYSPTWEELYLGLRMRWSHLLRQCGSCWW
jgi:hypothetical protein